MSQSSVQSNGQAVRRVRGSEPRLFRKLDEERAKRFHTPVTWEILSNVSGETSDVVHQGMIDHNCEDDRRGLAELAAYCYSNGFLLLTYVAEESE